MPGRQPIPFMAADTGNGSEAGEGSRRRSRRDRRTLASTLADWLRGLAGRHEDVRATLEDLLEAEADQATTITPGERDLLHNILKLRDLTAADVMVPRVDVMAIPEEAPLADVVQAVTARAHSRLPVYRETLDNLRGLIHSKDLIGYIGKEDSFRIEAILRPALVVAPSMGLLDLLVQMRTERRHMAMVVDEFGGIDGLVTIEDVVEEIVGEIQDEHGDVADEPDLRAEGDHSWLADARYRLADFEDTFGELFSQQEHDDVDTLGGLVFALAGRVPHAGERVRHPSGLEFEVLEGDARRVRRVRIHTSAAAERAEAGDSGK